MSNMHFMSLENALEVASFPANYTNEQIACALTVLANVVKKEIKKNDCDFKKQNYYLAACKYFKNNEEAFGEPVPTFWVTKPFLVKAENQLEAEEKVKNHYKRLDDVDKVIEVLIYPTIE